MGCQIILFTVISLSAQFFALNPKAFHPNGRQPTSIRKAKQKLPKILEEVADLWTYDDINSEYSQEAYAPPHLFVLIDGNNVRNSYGYTKMSATDLTKKLVSTNLEPVIKNISTNEKQKRKHHPSPHFNIICVWDGSENHTSSSLVWNDFISPSEDIMNTTILLRDHPMLTVCSASESTADDVIVKLCTFLSSTFSPISTYNKNLQKFERPPILIFTSDANLMNRCVMQLNDEAENTIHQKKSKDLFYHSIYLRLLLESHNDREEDIEKVTEENQIFTPDWERQERRDSVVSLLQEISLVNEKYKTGLNITSFHSDISSEGIMENISQWINSGMRIIEIGRVTKGGSILYKMQTQEK